MGAAGDAFVGRCQRFSGVDATSLRATPAIWSLFRDNDFGMRRGIIGCALSHIEVWRAIVSGPIQRCLILEDDVQLCDDFDCRFDELEARLSGEYPAFDLALLGYIPWDFDRNSEDRESSSATSLRPMRWERYFGGLSAYVASARGAGKLLELVDRDGVQNGIDRFVMYKGDELTTGEAEVSNGSAERSTFASSCLPKGDDSSSLEDH
jgi:GR25 family glycosyltransferase involved in LPS biosynthesis